jgi:hypothetical protein
VIDPSLKDTIRSSDGGLTRITSDPGGDDDPGDHSPDGKSLVFARADQNGQLVGLFVVNVNGTCHRRGLRTRVLPERDGGGVGACRAPVPLHRGAA